MGSVLLKWQAVLLMGGCGIGYWLSYGSE